MLHRDLKPGNVLVTPEGRAKVVDFGVGRMLDEAEHFRTLTLEGQLVGTLAFMSPEQLSGTAEIDTTADVYALGVIGYELLTGRGPFDLGTGSLVEVTRAVTEAEPILAGRIDPALRGDLETILARCLEKDPSRRYASAAALAEDLRRHRHHEPILARPATTLVRVRKFVARNPWLVAGGASTVVVLALGLVGTLWKAREAGRQRDAAVAMLDFLRDDVLAAAQPSLEPGRGRDASMRDALLVARVTLQRRGAPGGSLERLPEVRARLHHTLGQVFLGLGDFETAADELARASALAVDFDLGDDFRGRIEADRIQLEIERGDFAAAETRAALALARVDPRSAAGALTRAARARAILNLGRADEAVAVLREAHADLVRTLGERDPATLTTWHNLGAAIYDAGALEEGEEVLREVAAVRAEVLGPEHPDTLGTLRGLGAIAMNAGRTDDSIARFEQVLGLMRELYGEDHYLVQQSRMYLAEALTRARALDRAWTEVQIALGHLRTQFGNEHLSVLQAEMRAAWIAAKREDHAEALEIYDRILPPLEVRLGPEHMDVLRLVSEASSVRVSAGELDAGILGLERAFAAYRKALSSDHPDLSTARYKLGSAYARAQRWEDAEPLVRGAWESDTRIFGPHHPYTHMSLLSLAEVLGGLGHAEEARRHYETLVEHADPAQANDARTLEKARAALAGGGDWRY